MKIKAKVLDKEGMRRSIMRISHEIIEKNKGTQDLAIIGIRTRGAVLAQRLASFIKDIDKSDIPVGILDITLYRDDLTDVGQQPAVRSTEIDFDIKDKKVILADDVLFKGRTVRAAMDALIDLGRPKNIQLAVLIDRGHRELPIRADYAGKNVPTSLKENVQVRFEETDGCDEVVIEEIIDERR